MAIYKAFNLKRWDTDSKIVVGQHEVWIPTRPVNHRVEGWFTRIKSAFFVLIGKYDALDWEEDRSPEYWIKRLRVIRNENRHAK